MTRVESVLADVIVGVLLGTPVGAVVSFLVGAFYVETLPFSKTGKYGACWYGVIAGSVVGGLIGAYFVARGRFGCEHRSADRTSEGLS